MKFLGQIIIVAAFIFAALRLGLMPWMMLRRICR